MIAPESANVMIAITFTVDSQLLHLFSVIITAPFPNYSASVHRMAKEKHERTLSVAICYLSPEPSQTSREKLGRKHFPSARQAPANEKVPEKFGRHRKCVNRR